MINRYSALVIDDERLARKNIISLVSKYEMIDVIGEADNVEIAVEKISLLNPDILFLDIQMPGQNGFDLLEKVQFSGKIVFITAFDQYAIRAFEVNALDYLLKPVSPARFEKTIQRLFSNQNKARITNRLKYDDKLYISILNNYKFVSLSKIIFIEALGNYTKLYISEGQFAVTLRSMKEWEFKIPSKHFVRIHRSYIVNLDFISAIKPLGNYRLNLFLHGIQEPLIISRSYRKKIKNKYF